MAAAAIIAWICATVFLDLRSKYRLPISGVDGRGSPVIPLLTRGTVAAGPCGSGNRGATGARQIKMAATQPSGQPTGTSLANKTALRIHHQ